MLSMGRRYRFTLASGRSVLVSYLGGRWNSDKGLAVHKYVIGGRVYEVPNYEAALIIIRGPNQDAIIDQARI
jgi:hypothetical protein